MIWMWHLTAAVKAKLTPPPHCVIHWHWEGGLVGTRGTQPKGPRPALRWYPSRAREVPHEQRRGLPSCCCLCGLKPSFVLGAGPCWVAWLCWVVWPWSGELAIVCFREAEEQVSWLLRTPLSFISCCPSLSRLSFSVVIVHRLSSVPR